MQIDDVALEALLPLTPAARPLDSDVALEILFEDDELCDATATRHFERFSSPYERIELSEVAPLPRRAQRTTFAKTIALGKGTPCAGVPSLDARPTVEMPAVSAADTAEVPLASPADTLEMPAAADTLRTAAIVPRASLKSKAARATMLPIAPPPDSAEMPAFVPPAATVPFERVWFDDESELEASQELVAQPKTSWWWLAISLVAGAAAVGWMASL